MKPLTIELYQQALALGEQLRKVFPKCFFPPGQEKPLKTGIFHDLLTKCNKLSLPPDKKVLRACMSIYTSSIAYRAALITPNAVRVDLDGNEGDQVTVKERYKAKVTTRAIRWALDTGGYEAERAQAKSKLKEQSKKLKEVKEQEKEAVKNANSQAKNKDTAAKQLTTQINSPPTQTTTLKKSVPVIIKKRKTAPPENPKNN